MVVLSNSISFWIVLVEFFILLGLVKVEGGYTHILSGISLVISLALLQYVAKVDIISWVENKWPTLFLYLCSHVTIGTLWSMFKWFRFLRSELQVYREKKTRFLMESGCPESIYGSGTVPAALRNRWENEIVEYGGGILKQGARKYPPSVKNHKDEVITWIMYWPISMVCSIFGDLLSWLSTKVYNLFKDTYASIGNLVFYEIKKDLDKLEK